MLSHQVLQGLNEAIEFWWWKAKFSLPFPLESDTLLQPLLWSGSCFCILKQGLLKSMRHQLLFFEWYKTELGLSNCFFHVCVSPWTLPRPVQAALDSASFHLGPASSPLVCGWPALISRSLSCLFACVLWAGSPHESHGHCLTKHQHPVRCFSACSPGLVLQPLSVAGCLSWHQGLARQHQTLVWRRTRAFAKLYHTIHNQGKHFYPSLSRPCCPEFPFTFVQHSFQCYFSWSYLAAAPELTASCSVDPTGSPSQREGRIPFFSPVDCLLI